MLISMSMIHSISQDGTQVYLWQVNVNEAKLFNRPKHSFWWTQKIPSGQNVTSSFCLITLTKVSQNSSCWKKVFQCPVNQRPINANPRLKMNNFWGFHWISLVKKMYLKANFKLKAEKSPSQSLGTVLIDCCVYF